MTCKHDKYITIRTDTCIPGDARWCENCGAFRWPSGTWCLPEGAADSPDDAKKAGALIGGMLRSAFPGIATKVEKFVAEATEGSETIHWKPASAPPDTDRTVIGILDGDDGVYTVSHDASRFVEHDEDGVPHPIDVTWWAEMPKGPLPPGGESA